MLRSMVALSLLAMSQSAWAQVPALCTDAKTQSDANACAGAKLSPANDDLNKAYEKALAALSGPGQIYLRDAERAWVAFRDKECVSRTGGGPNQQGTIWPMFYDECLFGLTQERIKALSYQAKCPPGRLDLPAAECPE